MLTRRGLLTAAAPLSLSACGLHPLYMAGKDQADSVAARELAAINVPVMAERVGQLMRQALQDRLERFGIAATKRYDLIAPMSIATELVAIDVNTDITRYRYVASTNWLLRRNDVKKTMVKSGTARVLDGVNVPGSQFLSIELESDTTYRQFAATLADDVVSQIAGYFDQEARKEAT